MTPVQRLFEHCAGLAIGVNALRSRGSGTAIPTPGSNRLYAASPWTGRGLGADSTGPSKSAVAVPTTRCAFSERQVIRVGVESPGVCTASNDPDRPARLGGARDV